MTANALRNLAQTILNVDLEDLVEAGVVADNEQARGKAWDRFNRDAMFFIIKLDPDKLVKFYEMLEAKHR